MSDTLLYSSVGLLDVSDEVASKAAATVRRMTPAEEHDELLAMLGLVAS